VTLCEISRAIAFAAFCYASSALQSANQRCMSVILVDGDPRASPTLGSPGVRNAPRRSCSISIELQMTRESLCVSRSPVHPLSQDPCHVHAAVVRVICSLPRAVHMLKAPASRGTTCTYEVLGPTLNRLGAALVLEDCSLWQWTYRKDVSGLLRKPYEWIVMLNRSLLPIDRHSRPVTHAENPSAVH